MDIGGRRVLLVRVAIELLGERDLGAVVTFDDITNGEGTAQIGLGGCCSSYRP